MRSFIAFCLCCLAPFVAVGASDPVRVGVSVLPLEGIVKELGGDAVLVRSLQREGDSCSVFEPRPSSITWVAEAKLFFRTGVGYESVIMDKLRRQFSGMAVADLREAVVAIGAVEHAHAHDGHDHGTCASCGAGMEDALDPHIWMDPVRLAAMADFISGHLRTLLPEEAAGIAERTERFKARALAVHAQLEAKLAPHAGKAFFIYHPALAYFADRYGLRQIAIAGSGDSPTIRELHQRIRQARAETVTAIFVQPQESRRQAEVLAEAVGADVVEIDPMAVDWEENLLHIGEALARSFAKP